MTRRFPPSVLRLCLLLACGWLAATAAWAQQRPEAGPPSSRRCRWVLLAAERDTTFFELADTLTVVPSSVGGGERAGGSLRAAHGALPLRAARHPPAGF
ncbi:hypothetical protein LRS06_14650 [Hymenobacter sp. J193]|uniref:hypothetical protein n=1 Tax=Hymenobacter sp. J193 TaxID=2898429 RepID=UPI00215088A7|nr:hypothetical protein [Hymenobacter sp. J193]MCR5888984.1 hypothetical protein [Hymenobacter sp. J193]